MAKVNYKFEKRQKDMAKQRKRDEKQQRKAQKQQNAPLEEDVRKPTLESEPPSAGTTAGPPRQQ
ncbi:MAG: hypothetical protein PHU25_02685 [Deltaproteobacteria bacterium]|nr:hypothetical protein [Deltaproteobacteria bacterium]